MEAENRFVSQLSISMSNCSLYSREHAMTERSLRKVLEVLEGLQAESIEIMVVDEDLVISKTVRKEPGLHDQSLVKRFARKGITRVDFLKGASLEEMKAFVADMVHPGGRLVSSPHIRTGVVAIRSREGTDEFAEGVPPGFAEERVGMFTEVYDKVSPFKRLEVTGLEEIITSFITALRHEADVLKIISPVKAYSEYTYTHAANVAMLSLCQAESLGLEGGLLHDVGVAALMHDVGKLFISKEVLHKKGALEKSEFDEMKRHPMYGAYYLAKVDGLTHLAPLVAYEHHRKYDGTGYPEPVAGREEQHECSQIVAIADFFDALRSNRPYREGLSVEKILGMMREDVGSGFNPTLLANFEAILTRSLGSVHEEEEQSE
jgi:HD superfamily phosphohydrolase YqeK